ncbi:MAG: hypothetical protein ACD_79C00193G0001 [uncultured bacterium]|nr:MAG: hypothetical protein ACD_79C00193G0001 [uncultured bacterium]
MKLIKIKLSIKQKFIIKIIIAIFFISKLSIAFCSNKNGENVYSLSPLSNINSINSHYTNPFESIFQKDEEVSYLVRSEDKELGNIVEPTNEYMSQHEKEKIFTPAPLKNLREKYFMWDFMRSPVTDIGLINERQNLLQSLINTGDLIYKITELKNLSYLINEGINGLFAPIDVGEYHKEPALWAYRSGRKDLEEHIMNCFDNIKEGKKTLSQLITLLRDNENLTLKTIALELEKQLESVNHLDESFFLNENYDKVSDSRNLGESIEKNIIRLGAFVEFANIVRRDKYSRANFDESKPAEYSEGWNFVREKEGKKPQVLNDSAKDTPITVLCGANMGGKSFNLVQNFYMQLLAQSFGFVPAASGNFRIYDSFLYLDRASTESYRNLSAYGVEIDNWVEALKKIRKKGFVLVDEGFSTTSAEDQYAMLMGVAEYLKKRGGKTFLSSHNEAFVKNYKNNKDVEIYNFPFEILRIPNKKPEIKYSYKLTKGAGDSKALDVAEVLGLPVEIINLAKEYIKGILKKVNSPADKKWKKLLKYTEAEREALKKKDEPFSLFKGSKDEDSKLFQLFSDDSDFQQFYFGGSRIQTGEDEEMTGIGGWQYDGVSIRKGLLLKLITEGVKLDTKEIFERQKMFKELSGKGQYKELKEISDKVIWMLKFLPKYLSVCGAKGLLNFNKILKPDRSKLDGSENSIEYVIKYLQMNKKILGKDFDEGLSKLLIQFEKWNELIKLHHEYIDNVDVFDIQQAKQDDYNEEIKDKEVIEKYLTIAYDEPEREKWQGKLTRLRIKEYISWLKEHDRERWRKIEWSVRDVHPMRKLIYEVMGGYESISVIDSSGESKEYDAKIISDKFMTLASLEPLVAKQRWGNKVCAKRVAEYLDYLEEISAGVYNEDMEKMKEEARVMLRYIYMAQSGLNIKDEKIVALFSSLENIKEECNGRITHARLNSRRQNLLYSIDKLEFKIPAKSIFECDIKSISEEIRYFADIMKKQYKKSGDFDYYNNWPNSLILVLILEMLADERDYCREFIDMLKSHDSVYLHQMANYFEKIFKNIGAFVKEPERRYMQVDKKQFDLIKENPKEALNYFKRNKEKLGNLCSEVELQEIHKELQNGSNQKLVGLIREYNGMGVTGLFKMLNSIFQNKTKEMQNDYYEISKAYTGIFSKHDMVNSLYDIGYIRTVLENENTTDVGMMQKVMDEFGHLTQKRYDDVLNARSSGKELISRQYREFYKKEIVESGLKKNMENVITELEEAYNKAFQFINKYNIKCEDSDGRENKKDALDSLKNGNLSVLENQVFKSFYKIAYNTTYDIDAFHELDKEMKRIFEIQAIGLYGNMINKQKFAEAFFNADGTVEFKKLFSLFMEKEKQTANDVHFGKEEYIRLIAAPNMSGKTFYLKAIVIGILTALNTGYVPADSATLPVFDFLMFLDRVTAKLDGNLSALGNEVELWKKFFNILISESNVFVTGCVDEAFSTTSPKYQASLVYAIVMFMIREGQYLAIASHNHDVLQILQYLEKDYAKLYGLKFEIDGTGKPIFDYLIKALNIGEITSSEAIPAARAKGMPEEILKTAEEEKEKIKTAKDTVDINSIDQSLTFGKCA